MPTNADLLAELRAYNETVARDVAGLAAEVASLNRRIAALEMAAR